MLDFDEATLIEESKKHCEVFLQREQRALVTFTGDASLMYIPDPNLERFRLDPSQGVLYLPLHTFLEQELDENQILWHIYYELALYPDWKKQTKKYLERRKDWQKESEHMTSYILARIKKEGLEQDQAYQPKIISNYAGREIRNFLYILDKYVSFLSVLQRCPLYRDEENYKKIVAYMKGTGKRLESLAKMPNHQAFANSFLLIELYQVKPKLEGCAVNPFERRILNQPFFHFIRDQLVRQIHQGHGIVERDPFIRFFIYPFFAQLWKEELDGATFYKSKGTEKEQIEGSKSPFEQAKADALPNPLEATEEEVKRVLEEMLEQQERLSASVQSAMEGKVDINSLIRYYPDFVEAEEKGNYKHLPIFSRYLLEPRAERLPERIEISFVIDNSGSMNASKVESARKALAVTLLSIDDFNRYLQEQAEHWNQKVEVLSETWFFGSQYYQVKAFNDGQENKKRKSDIIRSIVKLNGMDGATDDGSCLKEISRCITPAQELELKSGKQIMIVFEITDGASSFPGSAKEAVQGFVSKGVEVFAFQIGKNSESSQKTFRFVWNEGYPYPRGVIIGEQVENLPQELLKAVGKNMESIFNPRQR